MIGKRGAPKTPNEPLDTVEAVREVEAAREAIVAGTDAIEVPAPLLEEPESPLAKSLHAQIQQMSVPQRVKLALKGNREVRMILVRDRNRMVPRMVLLNPRITEEEILMLAKDRNAEKELLRQIAGNRDWLGNYAIRWALVENAKTPIGDSLRLVPTLRERELRMASKSKNVPSAITSQARRLIAQKELNRTGK